MQVGHTTCLEKILFSTILAQLFHNILWLTATWIQHMLLALLVRVVRAQKGTW
jgi:hypothetical protein